MLYVQLSEIKIKGFNVFGYVLFNKDGEGLETNSFFNRLIDIEKCSIGERPEEISSSI